MIEFDRAVTSKAETACSPTEHLTADFAADLASLHLPRAR